MAFFQSYAAAMTSLGDYPFADANEDMRDVKIHPRRDETGTVQLLENNPLMTKLTLSVPADKHEAKENPVGMAYYRMMKVFQDPHSLPLLKEATIRASDSGSGPITWQRHCPPQLMLGLGHIPLNTMRFVRVDLSMFGTPIFIEQTKNKSLIFQETSYWNKSEAKLDLSDSVQSISFLQITDITFITWLLSTIPVGRKIAVVIQWTADKFAQYKWRAASQALRAIHSLTLVNPKFDDNKGRIWKDLVLSGVTDLYLVHPKFANDMFRAFIAFIKHCELQSLRIKGRVTLIDEDDKDDKHDATRMVLAAIAQSNIQWVSFKETSCSVADCVGDALPGLKTEVFDIGILPRKEGEPHPGKKLLDHLEKNKQLGAFKDEYGKQVAYTRGIYGLNVRSVQKNDGGDGMWEVWSRAEANTAGQLCLRNQRAYYKNLESESEMESSSEDETSETS